MCCNFANSALGGQAEIVTQSPNTKCIEAETIMSTNMVSFASPSLSNLDFKLNGMTTMNQVTERLNE